MTGFGDDPIPGMQPEIVPMPPVQSPSNVVLRVRNGPRKGHEFRLEGTSAVLGRNDPDNNIAVDIDLSECELHDTPVISRRHAELRMVAGQLQVVALNDLNGTYVNGRKIVREKANEPSQPVVIENGDILRVADLELGVIISG